MVRLNARQKFDFLCQAPHQARLKTLRTVGRKSLSLVKSYGIIIYTYQYTYLYINNINARSP